MNRNTFENDLRRIVTEYENEGYAVILSPKGKDVPAFLDGYTLDMIAMRIDENVVVAVRPNRRRESAVSHPRLEPACSDLLATAQPPARVTHPSKEVGIRMSRSATTPYFMG